MTDFVPDSANYIDPERLRFNQEVAGTRVNTYTVTLGVSAAKILVGANPRRLALWFLGAGQTYLIAPVPTVSATIGTQVTTGSLPVILTYQDLGVMVQLPIFGFSTNGVTATVLELELL